jgi:hypothetical protein
MPADRALLAEGHLVVPRRRLPVWEVTPYRIMPKVIFYGRR